LVSDIKGRTYIHGVSEQGVEENIWASEGGSGGRLHNEKLHNMYASSNIIVIKSR
jgi:hypothetical protein